MLDSIIEYLLHCITGSCERKSSKTSWRKTTRSPGGRRFKSTLRTEVAGSGQDNLLGGSKPRL